MEPETEPGADAPVVQTAVEIVGIQRQRLAELLEQGRRAHRECLQRLRQVELELRDVTSQRDGLGSDSPNGASAGRAVEVGSLRELQQLLRQRQLWLADELVRLASSTRKLQMAIRQTQLTADYLVGETDDDAGEVERASELSWLHALEVQEKERHRLAREIHDGPAQVLANAIFELEYCRRLLQKDQKDSKRLEHGLTRLCDDLRAGLAEVRYFIFDLRPAPLAELGLALSLRRYVETFQTRFGIASVLELGEDLGRLSPAREAAVFRIVQEALQNVRKHSGASRVAVVLRRESEELLVTVEDDGHGFDAAVSPASRSGHFGLQSMQERARLVRAELHVESEPDRGTRVILRVPVGDERSLAGPS